MLSICRISAALTHSTVCVSGHQNVLDMASEGLTTHIHFADLVGLNGIFKYVGIHFILS